jgi:hypothetical protein
MVETWLVRAWIGELTGGRASPLVEVLPPLEARWTLTVNRGSFKGPTAQCATSGLRLEFHAALVGSMRPGLKLSLGLKRDPSTTVLSSEPPAGDPPTSSSFSGRYLNRHF